VIKANSDTGDPPLTVSATVCGLAIYLDNFAMISLAKGDAQRRNRLVSALHTGRADLLFSITNAAELTGPQGRSLIAIRTFLDEVGPHWFPVELDPREVAKRELEGAGTTDSFVSRELITEYYTFRTRNRATNAGKVTDHSDDFLGLGGVLDWLGPRRDSIRKLAADLDAALIKKISEHRAEFDRDRLWLDHRVPALPFNPTKPAAFTYINLLRTLIVEAKSHPLKKGDGVDFCHVVIASAFASVAALDKHWKRRVEALPKPNGLARIYYQQELDEMVTYIESSIA